MIYFANILIIALFVICSPIITAVIFLVVTVVIASFLLFDLNINYAAIVYLLVYVGAILILLMFVVLAAPHDYDINDSNNNWVALALAGAIGLFLLVLITLVKVDFMATLATYSLLNIEWDSSTEQLLAQEFFGSNAINLMVVSVLLFIAIVGSIGFSI